MISASEGLFSIWLSGVKEERASPRYLWNNANRGPEPFVIIQYTHRGEGFFELNGTSHRVPAGYAFIGLAPENSRYGYPKGGSDPWVFSWINFYGEIPVNLWSRLRNQAGPVIALPPPLARLLHLFIKRSKKKKWADRYEVSVAAYKFYLETLRHIPSPRPTRPLQDVIAYFQNHYQKGISMKEVAAHCQISREHFTRLFARRAGCAPSVFLRRIRLEAAARMLRTTDLSIAEVGFSTGWTSPSKLDYFFKRHYGVLPREYRRRQHKSERGRLTSRKPPLS